MALASQPAKILPRLDQRSFHPLPPGTTSPTATYFADIKWGQGFERWPLVRFSTQGDGSCLFHGIVNAFYRPYHTEMLNGKHVSRSRMITALRRELSEELNQKMTDNPSSPTHYEFLNRGYTAEFAKNAGTGEYTLSHMQNELNSHSYIGYGYLEFLGNVLNKDIYVLEAIRRDIYRQVDEDLELIIHGNRNSIILYYMDNGHYELVGLRRNDGTFDTYFSPEHSLIRFLNQRVRQIIDKE